MAIHPFRLDVPEEQLTDLRGRLARTRWPDPEPVDDWSQGVPLAAVQATLRDQHANFVRYDPIRVLITVL